MNDGIDIPEHVVRLTAAGPRPTVGELATHLWGPRCNIDFEGNSREPYDRDWNELTLSLRGAPKQRIRVFPLAEDPTILTVQSANSRLVEKAADFIGRRIERTRSVLACRGEPLLQRQRVLIGDVVHQRGHLSIDVDVFPDPIAWQLAFPSAIGLKVLDERDMPEYWNLSVKVEGPKYPTFLYQVLQGGWFEDLWGMSKMNEFYGVVYEYIVVGEDYCVDVLTNTPPTLARRGEAVNLAD